MPSALHVAEAKYASAIGKMMILLCELDRRLDTPNLETIMSKNPICYGYENVPASVWAEFRKTEFGPEADVFYETEFKGKYNQQELSPILFLIAGMKLGDLD